MSRKRIFGAALASALVIGIGAASIASGAPAAPALTLKIVKEKNVKVAWSFASLPTRDGSAIEIQRSVNGSSFSTVQKLSRPRSSASWVDKAVPQGLLKYQARLLVNNVAQVFGPVAQITVGTTPTTPPPTTTPPTTVAPTTTTATTVPPVATGAYRWARTAGGPTWVDSAGATDVAFAADGTVVAVGSFSGTVDFGRGPRTSTGSTDVFAVGYSANGSALWDRTFGSSSTDTAAGVAVAPTGEVVVAGTFAGTMTVGGTALASAGNSDGFVAVLAHSNGAPLGAFAMGGTGSDGVLDVDVRDGAIAVSGSFNGTGSFGGRSLTSAGGGNDIFAAKYALATRAPVWGVRLGSSGLDRGWGVALDSTGAVVVAGEQGSGTGTQAMLAKLRSGDGSAVWPARIFNTASGATVAIAPDDDIVFAGTFSSSINLGGAALNALGIDIFVARFDDNGTTHRWSRRFGNVAPFSFTDTVTGIDVDSAGNTLMTGAVIGEVTFGGSALVGVGGSDPYLVKLSPAGDHVWSKRFVSGDLQYQRPGGVTTGPGNAVATAGSVLGRLTVDGHLLDARYWNNGQLLGNQSGDGYVAVFNP